MYKGYQNKTFEPLAVKEFSGCDEKQLQEALREQALLEKLNHENIVRLFEASEEALFFWLGFVFSELYIFFFSFFLAVFPLFFTFFYPSFFMYLFFLSQFFSVSVSVSVSVPFSVSLRICILIITPQVFQENGSLYFVMEFVDRGAITSLLEKSSSGKLPEKIVKFFTKQVLQVC